MGKIAINIATGSIQKEDMIVGIDLGTTNSLIAVIHPDTKKPVVLKEFDGLALVPSIIHFDDKGNVLVGEDAKQFLIDEPEKTIFSVKRLIGKSFQDLSEITTNHTFRIINNEDDSLVKVQVGDLFYSPIELSSMILKSLKQRAEHILKTPVNKAVITVPAYFNDTQRQATRDAGKLAGLDVLRIINEPTAASLAYGLGLKKDEIKTIAVYDLGGGTFDISILKITNGIFEVLSTNGDTLLGGDDFDRAIMNSWISGMNTNAESIFADKKFSQTLRLKAEEAKKSVSAGEDFEDAIGERKLKLTSNDFNSLVAPLVERTLRSCSNALSDAGLEISDIEEVLMVGGSTRMPVIKTAVEQFFKRELHDELNPDEVVALGAAIQADILAGNNTEFLLLDITPLSLGIETMGGLMDVLVPRNSKIPSKASRQYTTQKDGQPSLRISVYQGERDLVKDNRKLAEFNLAGIPGMPAGLPKVEISFLINADGILVVKAKELRSGIEQTVEVKPQAGLNDEDVERMLLESIMNAREDIATRSLVEARTEAQQLIDITRQFQKKHNEFLTTEEVRDTEQAITTLESLINGDSKDEIHSAITKLNEISRPYAERVMDQAIGKAMKGKSI